MDSKLPYYMAYSLCSPLDDEKCRRRDAAYMKSLYPAAARRLFPYIEEECDRLMYAASMVYDEYPDQLQLRLLCRRIYERAANQEEAPGEWLWDLVQVLTYQELLSRRTEHRKTMRKYY